MHFKGHFIPHWRILKLNLNAIKDHNKIEYNKRIQYTYHEGDYITLENPGIVPKLALPQLGPYIVQKVKENGTITIQKEKYIKEKSQYRKSIPLQSL